MLAGKGSSFPKSFDVAIQKERYAAFVLSGRTPYKHGIWKPISDAWKPYICRQIRGGVRKATSADQLCGMAGEIDNGVRDQKKDSVATGPAIVEKKVAPPPVDTGGLRRVVEAL